MKIAFTHYPQFGPEVTAWTDIPQCPAVGDSVAFDDDDQPIRRITHVRWVQEGESWHAEVDLG